MSGENGTRFAGLGLRWSGDGLLVAASPHVLEHKVLTKFFRQLLTPAWETDHIPYTAYHTSLNVFYLVNLSLVKRVHMFQEFFRPCDLLLTPQQAGLIYVELASYHSHATCYEAIKADFLQPQPRPHKQASPKSNIYVVIRRTEIRPVKTHPSPAFD